MNASVKFKLNVRTGEIELEGSEAFVERQIQSLEGLVHLMGLKKIIKDGESNDSADTPKDEVQDGVEQSGSNGNGSASFGEWMHTFKSELNDLDKCLITASFVQSQSPTNDFKTSEVNGALKDHGIKLSNPSVTLKRLGEKKLMFQTRKVGKLRFMRVSTDGQSLLKSLKRTG